ncbi:MAG: hypothetical protein N3A38_02555 [Planctomycetota bacterium]|nr:hypothetical protein [Planctomycetota bacterium]
MDAGEIAGMLEELADLSDLSGETPFKGRAYRKAAAAVRSLGPGLDEAIESGKLREVDGIGEAIFEKICALRSRGTHPTLERLRASVPGGLREIYRRSGLSARKVMALRDLGVGCPEDLAKAMADGGVSGLKGFDRKTIERLKAIFCRGGAGPGGAAG